MDNTFKFLSKNHLLNMCPTNNVETSIINNKHKNLFCRMFISWNTTRRWALYEDFEFEYKGLSCTIPKGFITDGASIPKILRFILSPTSTLFLSGIIHDYLYVKQSMPYSAGYRRVSRKEADKIFYSISTSINNFVFLNWCCYISLRLFGGKFWGKSW